MAVPLRTGALRLHVAPARPFLLAIVICSNGCATSGIHRGASVDWTPDRATLREAAVDAARDPRVWAPLAAAGVLQVDGWDRKISDWARRETPVFGSKHEAEEWSDSLKNAASIAYFSTLAATPAAPDTAGWLRDKSNELSVGLAGIAVTGAVTSVLKNTTGRTRPNELSDNSFPSGHTSYAAVMTGFARGNLKYMDMSESARQSAALSLDALTLGTAWARVEAGAHYPSDTLVGYALGTFVSRFFEEAFFGSQPEDAPRFSIAALPGGMSLQWSMRF